MSYFTRLCVWLCFVLCLAGIIFAETIRIPSVNIYRADIFTRAVPHCVREGSNLHLIYLDTEDSGGRNANVYYLRSRDFGINWDKPVALSAGRPAESAQILLTADERLVVFYAAGGTIYMIESSDAGNEWSAPYQISGRQTRAKNPSAVVVNAGDIHAVWENEGLIYYRRYDAQTKAWENIRDIADGGGTEPIIVNQSNRLLYFVWLQRGEVVCRPFDLTRQLWLPTEEVSIEAIARLNTTPGACRDLTAAVDSQDNLYVVWSNGRQLLSRVRDRGVWAGNISRMTSDYAAGIAPHVVLDALGQVFVAYVEDNNIVLCNYDSHIHAWRKNLVFGLGEQKTFGALAVGGNTSHNDLLPGYRQGYDIFWVEREHNNPVGALAFNNRSVELRTAVFPVFTEPAEETARSTDIVAAILSPQSIENTTPGITVQIAPYLGMELTPPVLVRGQQQTVRIFAPADLRVARAYATWGRINQTLQTTQLHHVGNNVFRGEYLPPIDLRLGEQEGSVFVQTTDGQIYKKSFFYRVLAPGQQGAAEQLTAQFYPHPLLPGRDIRVRAHIPESVQSQQVMLFLAEDTRNVMAVMLQKEAGIWQGTLTLPEDTPAGEYSASIICKTESGSFIRKKIKYSVHK